MNPIEPLAPDALAPALLALLESRGPLSSAQLQAATGKRQPTVSRALASLGPQVTAFGQGRSTRYGKLAAIQGPTTRGACACGAPTAG